MLCHFPARVGPDDGHDIPHPFAESQGLLHETPPHPVGELRTPSQTLQLLSVDLDLRLQILVSLPQLLVDVQSRDLRKEQKDVLSSACIHPEFVHTVHWVPCLQRFRLF